MRTIISGPSVVTGPLMGAVAGSTPQEYGVEFGPSIEYQGDLLPDVRFSINKDAPGPGSVRGHLNAPYFMLVDAVPAASNTALTVAANAVNGTALGNIAASVAGATLNVPRTSPVIVVAGFVRSAAVQAEAVETAVVL